MPKGNGWGHVKETWPEKCTRSDAQSVSDDEQQPFITWRIVKKGRLLTRVDIVNTVSDSIKIYCRNLCWWAICEAKATSGKYSMSHFQQTSHQIILILECVITISCRNVSKLCELGKPIILMKRAKKKVWHSYMQWAMDDKLVASGLWGYL